MSWKQWAWWKKGLVIFFGVGIIGNLAKLGDKDSKPASEAGKPAAVEKAKSASGSVTMASYAALKPGMTYEQAVKILGGPGKELSSNAIGGFTTVMYQWDGGFMANMNATFQNGKLVSKAQLGLK